MKKDGEEGDEVDLASLQHQGPAAVTRDQIHEAHLFDAVFRGHLTVNLLGISVDAGHRSLLMPE